MELHLPDDLGKIDVVIDAAKDPKAVIILAHGAGAGMHHPFMKTMAEGLSAHGIEAVRFNFPYMQQGKKSPGSPKKNIATWNAVVEYVLDKYDALPVFLSGKSYGGRMASHLLTESQYDRVKGIIYLGFPLHAPGKDSSERADHLSELSIPQLFLQGTKDKLANIELINQVVNKLEKATVFEIEGGDHSFKVPKSAKLSMEEVFESLINESLKFIEKYRK